MQTFGGSNPADAIIDEVTRLRIEARQTQLPVKVSEVARVRGIQPVPLYRRLNVEGCLVTEDGQLRIVLRRASGRPLQSDSHDLGRYRFSYAHEFAHSLAFDLSVTPPQRVAPLPERREEEVLCNKAARELVLPRELLCAEIQSIGTLDAFSIATLADKAQVSIHVLALQICERAIQSSPSGTVMILSRTRQGTGGVGSSKPRCIACAWYDDTGTKQMFIPQNKGVDCIVSCRGSERPWSLLQFHNTIAQKKFVGPMLITNEEIVIPNAGVYEFNGIHERVQESGYVWSTGRLSHIV